MWNHNKNALKLILLMIFKEQKDFYNEYWKNRDAISYSKRSRLIAIMKKLSPYCKPGTNLKILDLGCGDGRSVAIWSLFGVPFGLELSPEAVREANKCYPEFKIIEGDATNTPFEDNSFDVVINQEVIEHIENQESLLQECHRILKNGGHLILTTPNKYYFDRRKGGNYSNQPIEKIIGPRYLSSIISKSGFLPLEIESIIPKKGDYGVYYFLDRILGRFKLIIPVNNYLKNRFLLSAHLLTVAVNKKV